MIGDHPKVPDREQIELSLDRLLASGDFDASDRNRSFLRFIVEETLAGRSERIKAYTVATTVFGRHSTFDPQTDPIVRIEARRLRRSLERYYLMGGRSEPVVITVPKGCYIPTFSAANCTADVIENNPAQSAPERRAKSAEHLPSIRVTAFELDCERGPNANDGPAFTRKVIVALTRFSMIHVFGDKAAPRQAPDHGEDADAGDVADYVLSGGLSFEAARFTVHVILTERSTGRSVWAEFYQRPLKDRSFGDVSDEVASAIARTLAQPYGFMFSRRLQESLRRPRDEQTAYDAVLRFYQYWRHYDRNQHEAIRLELEQAVVAEPEFGEAFTCLSMVLSDSFRFGYDQGRNSFDARALALALARRAIELDPESSRAYQALSLAHWFDKDIEASFTALEIGFALNPNDTDIMAELGFRHALMMNWDKAVPLLERSFTLNPLQRTNVRVALSLYHYMAGRFENAIVEARRVDAPSTPYGHTMVAISAARLGYTLEAQSALASLNDLDPEYAEHVSVDLARRNVHPSAIASISEGLRFAGSIANPDTIRRKRRPRLLAQLDTPRSA